MAKQDWIYWSGECEWKAVFRSADYHWVNFTFVKLYVEYDKMGPQFEIEVGLLGFTAYVHFALPWKTDESRDLKRRVEEVIADPSIAKPVHLRK